MIAKLTRPFTRRGFVQAGSITAAALLVSPTRMFGDFNGLVDGMMRAAKTDKVNVVPLGSGLYVIENTGGNITVLDGPDGKLMVDSGIGGSHPQIMAALDSISAYPLKEVINTHWHFDHTGGNPWLHDAGARITSHENTRKHMAVATRVTPWSYTFPPTPSNGLPTRLLDKTLSFEMNGQQITVKHAPHAHTDGDLIVTFQQANVITAADTFWNGYFPFIDCEASGSINGMIKITRANLALATDTTKIVPGHGPLATKAALQDYSNMLINVRNTVMDLKRKDMTVEQVIAEKPTAHFDAKWGHYAVNPDDFVRLVYNEVCCDDLDN